MQRVVQRPQVGVHLLGQVAGQEAQLFAGFHGGAGEYDALDLLVFQCHHGHGDGQVGLARTGRPHGKGRGVALDGLDILLLAQGLALHLPSPVGDGDDIPHDFADAVGLALGGQADGIANARAVHGLAPQHDLAQLLQGLPGQRHLVGVAGQRDFTAVGVDFDPQLLVEEGNVLLADAEHADELLRRIHAHVLGVGLFDVFQSD